MGAFRSIIVISFDRGQITSIQNWSPPIEFDSLNSSDNVYAFHKEEDRFTIEKR